MAKPIVDRLERELEGQAQVVRLDVLGRGGREMAREHGVASMPTFLIFDGDGELIGRQVGIPDLVKIKALIAGTSPQSEQISP